VANTVTVIDPALNLGDHLYMHHGVLPTEVVKMSEDGKETAHEHRHSAAWTSFHGMPRHQHPDDPRLQSALDTVISSALPSEQFPTHDNVVAAVTRALESL